MSQAAHPYRKQLPQGLEHHHHHQVPGSYSANVQNSDPTIHIQAQAQAQSHSAPYPSSRVMYMDPSTGSTTSNNRYQSAHSSMATSNLESNALDYSTVGSYETPSQGSAFAQQTARIVTSQRTMQDTDITKIDYYNTTKKNTLSQSTALQNGVLQPPAITSSSLSKMGSSDSLPLSTAIVVGGPGDRASRPHSRNGPLQAPGISPSRIEPPDTPVGARSFSLPPQLHDDFNKSHQTSRSESPASLGTDLQTNYTAKSHTKQSKSVDLSHMYLLDRNESTHFTLTNESLSDVSQNLIRQYLGENSSSSLLPRMKTIEMYRKNVKKSNDPKVLFQYAQYMLQTALTMDQLKNDSSSDPEGGASLETNLKKQFLKEAIHYLKKLSDKGYTDAQYLLGDAYGSGALGKVDNKEAFSLFQGAAKHGHVESAYRTAYCYEEGLGVGRDSRRSIEFLKYAASKNHPAAMYKLGIYSFYSRMGLPDNVNVKKSGIQWLTRAVTNANELTNAAPYELGKIYDEGFLDIVIPDHKYSMELYVQAASLGHVKSAAILGKAYEVGDDVVPQDADLSIHYYTQAAVAGDPESMLALCAWYLMGNPPNLERDNFEAFQWAIRAAKLGFPKAQSTVGHFFEKGIGCDQNIDSAVHWYTLASEGGDDRAKSKLVKLSNSVDGLPGGNQATPSVSAGPSILETRPPTSATLDSANANTPPHMKKDTKREKKQKKEKRDKKDKDCVIM